jgi:WD40 repeat protein
MDTNKKIVLKTKAELKFHETDIKLIDVCCLRKLILTLSQDNIIILFNYETENIHLKKKYDEKITGITLNPSSFYIALSFSNKIIIYSIVLGELNILFEIGNLSIHLNLSF